MWHTLDENNVQELLKTNMEKGLDSEEVKKRIAEYGKNRLEEGKKKSIIIRFIEQFKDFMIVILILSAIVSAVISYIEQSNDYIDSIIIIGIVFLNALMGVIQESKAEKSIEALQKLANPHAKVKRDGTIINIPSEELVPGDIVTIETGSFVPADIRLINTYNLKVEESALTGETVPVEKNAKKILMKDTNLGDMENMAFATTIVVKGHAEGIVTETGMNTRVGKIAKMIITDEAPETPLQKRLGEVGKNLGITALIICLFVFLIGCLRKIPIMEIFMTSVGLAVAAIPEGLPAVVTIMLSIGITRMARKNSIIRRLPAVETLGSSTVIASDKTGTLTQNKMQIVQTFGFGENKRQILELGTMCTDCIIHNENGGFFVDGEATEKAITEGALKIGLNKDILYEQMPRIDDIPFDSERKMMTTIHKIGNKYRIITKGAPDILIKRCNSYVKNNQIYSVTDSELSNIQNQNDSMAKKALRVIAIAYKDIDSLPSNIDLKLEENLVFCGLIGMIDPPREGVKEAIESCKRAGIKTVMITR